MESTSDSTTPRQGSTVQGGALQAECLGAHVSIQGGTPTAPARGAAIGATALQLFTKTPNMWREPEITPEIAEAFQQARRAHPVAAIVSHDSYLINLASPDEALRAKSLTSFVGELTRSTALGLDGIVSHPGNFIDDHDLGIARNGAAIGEALHQVPSRVMVFLETTAGAGTVLGRSFEELRAIREAVDPAVRHRVAFCADTCHLYSAGYDLVNDFDGVWDQWDDILGMELLRCLHLNDSKTPFASHKDRHELLGEGSLGAEPFRRIMSDPRFRSVPKLLETPKGDDEVSNDRRMLALLRSFRAAAN